LVAQALMYNPTRSVSTYPFGNWPFSSFIFTACYGAQLQNLFLRDPGWCLFPPNPLEVCDDQAAQLDALAPPGHNDPDVTLVTLSIGGNDAGLSKIIEACINKSSVDDIANCLSTGEFNLTVGRNALTGTVIGLPAALAAIRARAPNAEIVVVPYPELVAQTVVPAGPRCDAGNDALSISFDTRTVLPAFRGWNSALNATIASLAHGPRTTYAFKVVESLVGGQVCGSQIADTTGHWQWPAIDGVTLHRGTRKFVEAGPESFHPNRAGQRCIAISVLASIADPPIRYRQLCR
jgi:hypothetical protein